MATARKSPARKTSAAKKSSVVKKAPPAKVAKVAAAKPAAAPADEARTERAVEAAPAKAKRLHGKFAMPEADFALIRELKSRAKKHGQPVRKNELLRAGLRALGSMDALALRGAIAAVQGPKAKAKAKKKPAKLK